MIISVVGCELGADRLDVREYLAKVDPDSLPRLEKTGFESVFREGGEHSNVSLARRILDSSSRFSTNHIDAAILVSSYFPTAPSMVQNLAETLKLPDSVPLFAIQDACTGYLTAISLAQSLVESGSAREVLVATFDEYSKYTHGNVSLNILFSDAMSLTTVSRDIPKSHDPSAPISIVPKFTMTKNKTSSADALGIADDKLFMQGSAVFQFVIETVPPMVREGLATVGLTSASLDWYLHQGSKFVVQQLSASLQISDQNLFRASNYGNTVSGSIPFQLLEHQPEKEFIGLVGFGMGLSAKVGIYKVERL